MPPDSQGYTFMDVSLHHEPLCTSISNTVTLPDVIRPQIHRAASTNTEFGTSAKHIDHASLTKSLPCNSGGPTIPEPDLHVHHHVQHEPHEDHLQDYRTVRAQLVARGQQWTGASPRMTFAASWSSPTSSTPTFLRGPRQGLPMQLVQLHFWPQAHDQPYRVHRPQRAQKSTTLRGSPCPIAKSSRSLLQTGGLPRAETLKERLR